MSSFSTIQPQLFTFLQEIIRVRAWGGLEQNLELIPDLQPLMEWIVNGHLKSLGISKRLKWTYSYFLVFISICIFPFLANALILIKFSVSLSHALYLVLIEKKLMGTILQNTLSTVCEERISAKWTWTWIGPGCHDWMLAVKSRGESWNSAHEKEEIFS